MIIARALTLGGLASGVDVDRPIVQLDLHHGVHRVLAGTLVAGAGSAGARREAGLSVAARADLTVGRALVALAAEADQIAVAGEVAMLAVHGDVAVTSAELADRALAVCKQIGGLARRLPRAIQDRRLNRSDCERRSPTATGRRRDRAKRQREMRMSKQRHRDRRGGVQW